MKRISFLLLTALLAAPAISPAQDAATEERLNKLSAQIDIMNEARDAQNKKIEDLQGQIRELQSQVSKPQGNYASADDLKQVADAVKEVDKKRVDDNQRVLTTIEKLGKMVSGGGGHRTALPPKEDATPAPTADANPNAPHFEYPVQSGDTLSAIVKAYRDKGYKITLNQVLAANPGLKAENMKVGQKIVIPAAPQ